MTRFLAGLTAACAVAVATGAYAKPVRHPAPVHHSATAEGGMVRGPIFVVDPFWPKPLPHHWITGAVVGLSIDSKDNVWIIHRASWIDPNFKAGDLKLGKCCFTAPPVIEFDQAGNVVKTWGGPGEGYHWPDSEHGITVDHAGNVWIGGNGKKDTQILKFTNNGKFLMQIGTYGVHHGNNDLHNFWRPAKVTEDAAAREVYVADGYGNQRIVVLDEDTGEVKRYWGAYGKRPMDAPEAPSKPGAKGTDEESSGTYNPNGPPSKSFNTVHCSIISNDGLVYVCDRRNDRIQIFHKDGTFVREVFIEPDTLRSGSVWDMAFSRDPQQRYIYVANGVNERIDVLDRATMKIITSFGDGGRLPGEFFGCHNIATDSKGNLYVAETYQGARVQRFLFKGIGLVKKNQGVVWPKH